MSTRSEKAAYNKGYLAGKKNGNGHQPANTDKQVLPKEPVEVVIQRGELQISIKETPA